MKMKRFLPFWKRQFVSFVKRLFRAMGYDLVSDSSQAFTMNGGLLRAKKLGIVINTVIDIGASNGRWSEMCMSHFPDANYLLIEAQQEYEPYLKELRKEKGNIYYSLSVASNKAGNIYFDDSIVGSGIASFEKLNNNYKMYSCTTVDEEIRKNNLKPPFLIKFDTHGFETLILEGAKEAIFDTNLIIMEAYNFKLNDTCLRFHEMLAHLENLNFRCIDIIDLHHRKKDNLLWQMDIFMAKNDLKEFEFGYYN